MRGGPPGRIGAGLGALGLALGVLAGPAGAQEVALDAGDRGHYRSDGSRGEDAPFLPSTSYHTGDCQGCADADVRSFFVFDLNALGGAPIADARLRLYNPAGGYDSGDATETFHVSGVDTISPLVLTLGTAGVLGWQDLGDGPV